MNTDGENPLYKAESQQIVGAAMRLGYILNFKRPKLEWKRVIR